MKKKTEILIYCIFIGIMIVLLFSITISAGVENKKLNKQLDKLTKEHNNVRGENIILKSRIDYEIQQKLISYRMIYEKVSYLNQALSRIYPGYDYRKKIDDVFDDNSKIETLPESLIEIYIEQKLIIPHGLENYQKTIPEIAWPVDPKKAYITTKNGEYGRPRPYSYMKYKHEGIDIGSPFDDEVKAPYSGKIYRTYWDEGGGNCIEIKFKINNIYHFVRIRHLERTYVKKGDAVIKGQIIASAGNTGVYSLGKHIHFELWEWRGYWKNINPVLNTTWGNRILTSIN